jgi:acyl transferase domain-containing protein/acyl carrier protein
MIAFDDIKIDRKNPDGSSIKLKELSGKDIAIIGIGVKLPLSDTVEQFWDVLKYGKDCIRPLPEERKKTTIDFIYKSGKDIDSARFGEAAYLEEIDKFDSRYFNISPKESCLMDPNQRLFLQTAWKALEDAGYGGDRISGSRTGVYAGFNSDSEYKDFVSTFDPEYLSMALAGNVKPIVASRLSYILDLKGPSMLIDSACSSSLVAVDQACRAIRNGQCNMALVGGVQVHIVPVKWNMIGVEAGDGRTKAFDKYSDGTGTGEGVIAMLLKPCSRAEQDGDNIYAVIKGSFVNHDGSSAGITAPNAKSQEDLIIHAWKEAGIDPDTIDYIETHGTGTKLGDPIEIEGIRNAFRRFTDRRQFCGIGSVKTNIGHLDYAAGMAGLLKAVLALKHGQIPPSINFNMPNDMIEFESSPVYVNDRLRQWDAGSHPRRCGINSFGLSGTNCHVVLEEYRDRSNNRSVKNDRPAIFTISAKTPGSMNKLVEDYKLFFGRMEDGNLVDLCHTSNTGRGHYGYRMALICDSLSDLKKKIQEIQMSTDTDMCRTTSDGIFYGINGISNVSGKSNGSDGTVENDAKVLTDNANIVIRKIAASGKNERDLENELCRLYINGADPDWHSMYPGETKKTVRLPVYPFDEVKCWVKMEGKDDMPAPSSSGTPLLDRCLARSMDTEIYSTDFDVERHWVLNEHRINGIGVLVGTAYLELVLEACKKNYPGYTCLENVQFLQPLVFNSSGTIEVQTELKMEDGKIGFFVASRRRDNAAIEWIRHVEGRVSDCVKNAKTGKIDIVDIKNKYKEGFLIPDLERYNESTSFEFGPRWNNIREVYAGNDGLITFMEMPERFRGETENYILHPSLMDNALATIPVLMRNLSVAPNGKGDNGVFLPFSFGRVRVQKPLPPDFFSYVRSRQAITDGNEMISFDISFCDNEGNIFAEIENYVLKKTVKEKIGVSNSAGMGIGIKNFFYKLKWIPYEPQEIASTKSGDFLIICNSDYGSDIAERLRTDGVNATIANHGTSFGKNGDGRYVIGKDANDYDRLLDEHEDISSILYVCTFPGMDTAGSIDELKERIDAGVHGLFHLNGAISRRRQGRQVELIVVVDFANIVTGTERTCHVENSLLIGLTRVIKMENSFVNCRVLDIDDLVSPEPIVDEIDNKQSPFLVALRNGKRFISELDVLENDKGLNEFPVLKKDGVYLITGGTGGIGLELAKHLSQKSRINIALLGRSVLPERSKWDHVLKDGSDRKSCRLIDTMMQIEANGSRVFYRKADVASVADLESAVFDLKDKFGNINGVIHCAGIAGNGFLVNKNFKDFKDVLAPKVIGTWLLDSLTDGDQPDFFINFSSNNTLIGIPGQGDYTAANEYLDSAAAAFRRKGKKAITINWPAWSETGMAYDHGTDFRHGIMKALSTAEALGIFDEILSMRDDESTGRIIVGELNPGGSLFGVDMSNLDIGISDRLKHDISSVQSSVLRNQNRNRYNVKDILLKGKSAGDYTSMEKEIAGIWGEVLGYDEFDITGNFFELGGDSMSLVKMHSLIDERYPKRLQIGDMFNYPSIGKLADFLDNCEKKYSVEMKNGNVHADNDEINNDEIENEILRLLDEAEKGGHSIDTAAEMIANLKK